MTRHLWSAAKSALERVEAQPPALDAVARRARTHRTRRYAVGALALVVVGSGVVVPLRILSRLDEPPRADRNVAGQPSFGGEYPPEPTGPVIEVASGTAFGRTWTLSAYRAGADFCYRITGGGGVGCVLDAAKRAADRHLLVMMSDTDGIARETFAHGVVSKDVAGITLTLADGRVLSGATLRSRRLPLAFYVFPYEETGARVISIEALDEKGEVLEEHTP